MSRLPFTNQRPRELSTALRGVMLTAAIAAKGSFQPWSQYTAGFQAEYDLWLGGGLCHGLAIKYLACIKAGQNFSAVIDVNTLQVPDMYNLSGLHDEVSDAARAGNRGGEDLQAQNTFMFRTYGFRYVEHKVFGDVIALRSHTRCGSYVSGTGYYLVTVPSHTMAVAATQSALTFFDPNCGLFTCQSSSQMSSFFSAYFGNSFVKLKYNHDAKPILSVSKYR
jgi:hypothetical protein